VSCQTSNTYLALMHYPIYDKQSNIVSTSITNLDIHDFSRLARTYGLAGVFLVSPIKDQEEMVGKIVGHWKDGYGKEYNCDRAEALETTWVAKTLRDVKEKVTEAKGEKPLVFSTSAKFENHETISCEKVYDYAENSPIIIVFGTGFGLAETVVTASDKKIEVIGGFEGYNHLSVRSAASILVDRIFGKK